MKTRQTLTQQEVEKAVVHWLNEVVTDTPRIPDDAVITFHSEKEEFAVVEHNIDTDE